MKKCPNCEEDIEDFMAEEGVCPHCGEMFDEAGDEFDEDEEDDENLEDKDEDHEEE